MKKILLILSLLTGCLVLAVYFSSPARTVDLLRRYPTTLTVQHQLHHALRR